MLNNFKKIALGGGCHWCTEAVFQSLLGVKKVEQGYVASHADNSSFSEAVIVHFNSDVIPLKRLIEIHLYTHQSKSMHSMREKYRSAVYTYSEIQKAEAKKILENFQPEFNNQLITQIFSFREFKASREELHNYYLKDPQKPFCKTFIAPKLNVLLEQFSENIKSTCKN
ncbi:peptide-methionine (S)-S-oxide reductase [Gillisia sp. CAL575]|uniref:peptide-methionine (S)-S-oxide reductase n=1 Tax=Gillisia sp. CAL575 TaxID=985255 RepID=UPI0003A6D220|nr:peptide-methionine (S)-S-oxide reductase [Gillisia sp. CAL575]